jgi:hypothetical protein
MWGVAQPLRSFDQGIALSTLQRYDEALAVFDLSLLLAPRDGDAWQAKSLALRG